MDKTDIVVTTRNRLSLLRQTLDHIHERTRTPYRLHVIDDGSSEDNSIYLYDMWEIGCIDSITLRRERHGAMAAQNVGNWLAFSDPFVMTDDDVLCPEIDPDWLSMGLAAMRGHKKLAMMCLHHPGAKYKPFERNGRIIYCQSIGATFCFMRRSFIVQHPLPHSDNNLTGRPMERRCRMAHRNGWKIGYLHGIYCYHTGKKSQLTNGSYLGRFIEPKNWRTLEPAGG